MAKPNTAPGALFGASSNNLFTRFARSKKGQWSGGALTLPERTAARDRNRKKPAPYSVQFDYTENLAREAERIKNTPATTTEDFLKQKKKKTVLSKLKTNIKL